MNIISSPPPINSSQTGIWKVSIDGKVHEVYASIHVKTSYNARHNILKKKIEKK